LVSLPKKGSPILNGECESDHRARCLYGNGVISTVPLTGLTY